MNVQIALGLITLAFSVMAAIGVYSWRGGEWKGGERRHSEDIDKRMEQASEELSKLTGKIQALMDLKGDMRVAERALTDLERRVEVLESRFRGGSV